MKNNNRILTTLRRRIERVGAARHLAFATGDMVAWKKAADRANALRDALLNYLFA